MHDIPLDNLTADFSVLEMLRHLDQGRSFLTGPGRKCGPYRTTAKFTRHNGARECARRRRQIDAGQLKVTP